MTDRPIVDELNCRYWYMYSCSRHFPRLEALRLARTPRAGSQHSRRFFCTSTVQSTSTRT